MIALCVLLSIPALLAAEPMAPRPAGIDVAGLAEELSRSPDRVDMAVAIYARSLGKKGAEEAVAAPLFNLLVTQPARPAWIPVYEALIARRLLSDSTALEMKLGEAQSLDPAQRAAGVKRLKALAAANKQNQELRRELGEALLRAGKPAEALPWFTAGGGTYAFPDQAAAALIATGDVVGAVKAAPSSVPAGCATRRDAVSCGQALWTLGFPELAESYLKSALSRSLRSSEDRAAAHVELARIAAATQGPSASVWAWREAHRLRPADDTIRLAYIRALTDSGQAGAARSLVKPEEPIAKTVQAVQIVSAIDLNNTKVDVTAEVRLARTLDPHHPAVVKAWAHHLIATNDAKAAIEALNPYMAANAGSPVWVGYFTWAAAKARQSDQAVAVLNEALHAATNAKDWAQFAQDLGRFESIAGEEAKVQKRFADAEQHYERALALNPDSVEILRGLGGARWDGNDRPGAVVAYRRALELDPRDEKSVIAMAQLLRAQGETAKARVLLASFGVPNAQIQALDAELALSLETDKAKVLLDGGDAEGAIFLLRALLERYPNDPLVLHALADAYASLRRHDEALLHYRLARKQKPDDVWLLLGEVNALIALNRVDEAHTLLDKVPDVEDARAAKVKSEAGRAIALAEAAALVREGRHEKAMDIYERLLRDHADVYTLNAVASAYQGRWQHEAAEAFYREALRVDPNNEESARGLVEALLAQGRIEAARDEARDLVKRSPNSQSLAVAARVDRFEAISRSAQALAEGRGEAARFILADQLEANPGEPDLEVAMGSLHLREGNAQAAWGVAVTVLQAHPTHGGALSLAQNAAVDSGHTKEVIALYKAADAAGADDWVEAELPHLVLLDRMQRARDLHARGQPEAAEAVAEEAQRHYGNNQVRTWVIIGTTWLAIERPDRALSALETARALDPGDPGMALGLAATYEQQGRPGDALAVLEASWAQSRDVNVGARLAALQYDRGNTMMAQRTVAETQLLAAEGGGPSRRIPDPLRPLALPSGDRPNTAQSAKASAEPALPQADVAGVDEKVNQGLAFTGEAGGGGFMRPGDSGEQFFNVVYFPVGAEVGIGGPFRLLAQAVPVRITDGVHNEAGTAVDIGLSTSFTGNTFLSARIGSSPLGFSTGNYTTGYVVFGAKISALQVEVDGGKAPVTNSVTSWAGVSTEDGQIIGAARDGYLGAKVATNLEAMNVDLSVLGRTGNTTGPSLATIPWKQVMAEARWTLKEEPGRSNSFMVKGIYLDHEGQVDGFELGGAGMFSPDRYYAGRARFEGLWYNTGRWSTCAAGGAGPEVVQGEPTLYLNPGVYVGYEVEGGMEMALAPGWKIGGHVLHEGTWGAYGQTGGFAMIRYGARPDSGLQTPSPTFTSLIHGPALSHPTWCGEPWPR